jgi:anti-anti-sigma factor
MHLKLFELEQFGEVVVVTPIFDGHAFRYQDLQVETNAIRSRMAKAGCTRLVVDLHQMSYFGSEFIGALIAMLRETKGRGGLAFFCAAHPNSREVLGNTGLLKLWPHFETRAAAIEAAISTGDGKPAGK